MTRKKTLLIISTIFLTTISFAQENILIGINGGATYSNFRGNTSADRGNSSLDFLIGGSVEFPISEKFSIKTNLNYERKSTTVKGIINSQFQNVKVRSTYSYLSLPILAKYKFGESNDFYINGGPFVAFLLNAKSKSDVSPTSNFTYLNKTTDVGLSFGVGKRFNISDQNYLDLEIRNNLGLINISAVDVIDEGTLKTNSLNLILTYNFSF